MARLLITGVSGFLGSHVASAAAAAGHFTVGTWHKHPFHLEGVKDWRIDLASPMSCSAMVLGIRPDCVLHLAAESRPDACAKDANICRQNNVESTRNLAEACKRINAHMLLASTDLVYSQSAPDESSPAAPLGLYGRTKLEAEAVMARLLPESSASLRLSLLYGAGLTAGRCFVEAWIEQLRQGHVLHAFTDQERTPILAQDAAAAFLACAAQKTTGIVHVAGPQTLTRHAFALELCAAFSLDSNLVQPSLAADVAFDDPRPLKIGLGIERLKGVLGRVPLGVEEGLKKMAEEGLVL
jgi:dTDP-4-dehydrorhamnose reductase